MATHEVGARTQQPLTRAQELEDLVSAVKDLVVQFVEDADQDASSKAEGHGLQRSGQGPRTTLVEYHPPHKLQQLMDLELPDTALGREGLLRSVKNILQFSVNTWDQGFMDKLYASTTPVGVAADLLLGCLNTNLHVYQVSPALTVLEKHTARTLARMFGFDGSFAGGISQPGGSAANQTAMVVARNNLFPETKTEGYGGKRFVIFTSAHGHYSLEKAAQILGLGSAAVRSVPVDEQGQMRPQALAELIEKAKDAGEIPFFVNATAGTTVLGSFDPLDPIADICKEHELWLHVDGSWGAPVIFSEKQAHKLKGVRRADTITICPHKMMGVPVTCSFLLAKDLRQVHKGMTLPAGYLFHDHNQMESTEDAQLEGPHDSSIVKPPSLESLQLERSNPEEVWDLADLTPQCGRRGDSLKLALTWQYIGAKGFAAYIDSAFDIAAYLTSLVDQDPAFSLVSSNPPPCLQVCFYYRKKPDQPSANDEITERVSRALIPRGFMVDYAPGNDGKFFRVVVNGGTQKATVEGLLKAISAIAVD